MLLLSNNCMKNGKIKALTLPTFAALHSWSFIASSECACLIVDLRNSETVGQRCGRKGFLGFSLIRDICCMVYAHAEACQMVVFMVSFCQWLKQTHIILYACVMKQENA